MAKKVTEENPVDETYLRSLMAGTPQEPPTVVPSSEKERGDIDEEPIALTSTDMPITDNPDEKPISVLKNLRTTLTEFIRNYLTPYKCDARQGVYIDRELHQKISVIVGIAGKRQLTVGNYIDNVLKEHFEKHADEVKSYCQKSYNKIF